MVEGITCPKCGSDKIATVLYGLPDFTDELIAKMKAGDVVLNGCIIDRMPYRYECQECGIRFENEYERDD